MLINPLMRTRKPRQFEYKPRYFDPEQEAREARKREVLGADYQKAYENCDDQEHKPGETIRLRRGIIAERQRAVQQKNRSNITRLLIVLMLLILFILWLYS